MSSQRCCLLGATVSSPQDQGCPFYFERQPKPALPAFQNFHQILSGSFPLQTLSTDISSLGLTCSYPSRDPIPVSKSCPKLHPFLKHSLCLSRPNSHLPISLPEIYSLPKKVLMRAALGLSPFPAPLPGHSTIDPAGTDDKKSLLFMRLLGLSRGLRLPPADSLLCSPSN